MVVQNIIEEIENSLLTQLQGKRETKGRVRCQHIPLIHSSVLLLQKEIQQA